MLIYCKVYSHLSFLQTPNRWIIKETFYYSNYQISKPDFPKFWRYDQWHYYKVLTKHESASLNFLVRCYTKYCNYISITLYSSGKKRCSILRHLTLITVQTREGEHMIRNRYSMVRHSYILSRGTKTIFKKNYNNWHTGQLKIINLNLTGTLIEKLSPSLVQTMHEKSHRWDA